MGTGKRGRRVCDPDGMAPEKNDESLRRLGGGRWQTRDGRLRSSRRAGRGSSSTGSRPTISDFRSCVARSSRSPSARAAVEDAREGPIPESPLADRIKKAGSPKKGKAGSAEPKKLEKPAEPRWLTELSKSERERAERLLAVLVGWGLSDAEEVVRDDLDRGSPALARLAIARAVEKMRGPEMRPMRATWCGTWPRSSLAAGTASWV